MKQTKYEPPRRSAPLVGRDGFLAETCARVARGETILVYGPVGSGKSAVGSALVARAERAGRPAGAAYVTASLGDLTGALARAYPHAARGASSQRAARSRLRAAVEERPGVIVLDHLGATGTAFKGALRALRGTGLGVLLLADVETPRDHARVRALALTQHEIALPRLHATTIRSLLARRLAATALPRALAEDDLAALAAAAEGLPGRAVAFAEALGREEAWLGSRPRIAWLKSEAAIRAAERYMQEIDR